MKYYLIAGEPSGDLHGANLIEGLRKADPEAQFRFWGGDRMAAAGGAANLAKSSKTCGRSNGRCSNVRPTWRRSPPTC